MLPLRPLEPPSRPPRLTSVKVLVFIIATLCAAGTVTACGTERQASASHPAASAASTATSRARTPVSLTAVSNGTTVRLFRGQSVSVELRGSALSWHVPAATGRACATNQCRRRLPKSPASARDVPCHLARPRGPQQLQRHRLPARPAILHGRATVMASRRIRYGATFQPAGEPVVVGCQQLRQGLRRDYPGARVLCASSQRARLGAPGRRPARASSMARWNVG